MNPLFWLQNATRNAFRRSWFGRTLLTAVGSSPLRRVHIVSATRLSEDDFWHQSALGQSLKPWLSDPMISADIKYKNNVGLPTIYNEKLQLSCSSDILVFVHDDVWLDDAQWVAKLQVALQRYDIVGVVGNKRISPQQPAWPFSKLEGERFTWDTEFLSGSIAHGIHPNGDTSVYGSTPAECRLLDGVFLAVRQSVVNRSRLRFDGRFSFHFYDMDFCRNAKRLGLSLGTWPIKLTHQSGGSFRLNPDWQAGRTKYFLKWKS